MLAAIAVAIVVTVIPVIRGESPDSAGETADDADLTLIADTVGSGPRERAYDGE